ncbi:MAG: glycosyltransferase [Lachnospiraceae bacterium]|jgi:glycosyltransferase involved in cell wall biosynthesis|nr:glycosyltransferase [Lachnospiraceae bacterium]
MKNSRKIKVSQTMIVKNEEKNMLSALSWGKDMMVEQIVVDTGSTDRTVEISSQMGAKIMYFKWIDDFAAAKNFAIDSCTGDWIVIMDADEYFSDEDAAKLPRIIEKADKEGFVAIETGWVNVDGKGGIIDRYTQIRIIKNIKSLRYKRRIHEILDFKPGQYAYDASDELNIIHTGYIEEIAHNKNKRERNHKLLLKELEVNRNDPEILGYLADDYAIDEYDKAIEYYKRAIANIPDKIDKKDARTATTFTKLIILLSQKHLTSDILETYKIAEEKMPENSNIIYYTGLYFYNEKDYKTALGYYNKAFEKYEANNGRYSELWENKIHLAYAQYGHILLELNDIKGSVSIESKVLTNNKKEYLALVTLIKAFYISSVPEEKVFEYLGRIYDFSLALDKVLVFKASKEIGYKGLSDHIYTILNDKEKEVISKGV